jgi:hypothetical protein
MKMQLRNENASKEKMQECKEEGGRRKDEG